jgi:multiple sugar transport system ATP-binding protein
MAVVDLQGLTKIFPGSTEPAANDVTIHVGDGDFMVLLGPSGCGKSTVLRMIAGLETITSGTLTIDGQVMNRIPAKDRDIAMVFQSYALYPHMKVWDNLAFGLKRRGFSKEEIAARVKKAADTLGLAEYLHRKPHALSGGQRQRVALGRAIVRDPKVFLFDEPLSNLDAALRVSMRNELVSLHQRLRATMVYVTHDQVEAMTMGTRICVINKGRVVQIGHPMEVYRRPANTFVAGFLGSPPMNLLPAEVVTGEGGAPLLRLGTARVPVRDAWRGVCPRPGAGIVLGIRPEDIFPAHAAPGGADVAPVEAEVTAVEALGAETVLILAVDGPGHRLVARMGRDVRAVRGDRITVNLDLQAAHLFNPETTEVMTEATAQR